MASAVFSFSCPIEFTIDTAPVTFSDMFRIFCYRPAYVTCTLPEGPGQIAIDITSCQSAWPVGKVLGRLFSQLSSCPLFSWTSRPLAVRVAFSVLAAPPFGWTSRLWLYSHTSLMCGCILTDMITHTSLMHDNTTITSMKLARVRCARGCRWRVVHEVVERRARRMWS